MANPVQVTCLKNQWTKIATGVTTGQVHVLIKSVLLLEMHKIANDPAPTERDEGVVFEGNSFNMAAKVPTDFYLWSDKKDSVVRVDL